MAASHSGRSTSPDLSVSSSASVFSSFEGTMRSDRFWLPQEMRNFWTSSSFLTACKISSFVSVPESSLSIMMNTSRAAFRKPALNSSSAAAAARSRRSRSSASCSRRFLRPRWIASSHSSTSTSPELSVSSCWSAWSRRFGLSKNCRFSSPQFWRKSLTSSSLLTASTISAFAKAPESSLSIISKTLRAAFKNSAVNAAISAAASLARRSRSAARCASFALSAVSMAVSHSGSSISPEPSESMALRDASSFDGMSRYWRLRSPQSLRNFFTSAFVFTAPRISWWLSEPLSSLSMSMKTSRAALRNAAENASSSARAARSRRSRSSRSCSSRAARPRWIASSHSSSSTSPDLSVSRASSAFFRRLGRNKNWRFGSPQFSRKSMTSWSSFTARVISSIARLPEPSLSIISKTFWAAAMNSAVKASISLRHARARSSRSAARCRSFSFSASAMALSHSGAEISPSKSASSSSSVASNRAGTSRSCRYLLPQFTRKAITSLLLLTAFMISPRSNDPLLSTSIMSKIWRAMFRKASEKAASSAAAACSRRARASWSCSTRFFNPRWIATSHSSSSISPSLLVSNSFMALSMRFGCNKNCKFLSPQVWRNVTTSLSFCTESTTSCLTSVPDLSLSMSLKAFLAAFRNSAVNSSSSFLAASARASRSACRAASFAFSAASMAACHSLRSISPSSFVSMTLRAFCRRLGTNKYCKFLFPQPLRKSWTLRLCFTAFVNSSCVNVSDLSSSIMSKISSASLRNSAVNWPSAAAAARSRRSRSSAMAWSRFSRPAKTAASHSSRSTSPLPSVSISIKAFSSFLGLSSAAKNSFPQLMRNLTTSSSSSTPLIISSRDRVPPSSTSSIANTCRAKTKTSAASLSRAFRASARFRARSSAIWARRTCRAFSMASSHSSISMTPLPSVSRAFMALSNRLGINNSCRNSLPQSFKKFLTIGLWATPPTNSS